MKNINLLFLVLNIICGNHLAFAQISVPYTNCFDAPEDSLGWSHYALNGNDDWELGVPDGFNLDEPLSEPNVWATNLDGELSAESIMVLESPGFDLSDTNTVFRLGFAHQYNTYHYNGGNIDYSLDNGQTWMLLNGTDQEKNQWYTNNSCNALGGEPAWSGNYSSLFKFSYHSLGFLGGESNVKFRFKFGSSNNPREGWALDCFSIVENSPNVYGVQVSPVHATKTCDDITLETTLIYSAVLTPSFFNTVHYYWSVDDIFDPSDVFIDTKSGLVFGSGGWDLAIELPPNLYADTYYVFFQMDANNVLEESDETDNLGTAIVIIDSIYSTPYIEHFDNGNHLWKSKAHKNWNRTPGNVQKFEGTHSGSMVWSIIDPVDHYENYIESPYIDVSGSEPIVVSFWYRSTHDLGLLGPDKPIKYRVDCNDIYTHDAFSLPRARDNEWDFCVFFLPEHADTSDHIRLQIYNGYTSGCCYYGYNMVVDDVYAGPAKPDLSIERDKENYFVSNTSNTATLNYFLNNSGLKESPVSNTAFYWSLDSIFDSGDVLLGTKEELAMTDTQRVWTNFVYTKPTLNVGRYYIFYQLDVDNAVDEMREYNNEGYFVLYQQAPFAVPYFNDFETQIDGWRHNASLGKDEWMWSEPNGEVLNEAFSGEKGWITADTGQIARLSRMHLYSPVFDLSSSTNPVLEFDMKLDRVGYTNFAAYVNMSYSIDGGATWTVLDTASQSFNLWLFHMEYRDWDAQDELKRTGSSDLFYKDYEYFFPGYKYYNGRDIDRNTRFILDISFLVGLPDVQFRYNMSTEKMESNFGTVQEFPNEGAFIDNFSIKEAWVDLRVNDKKSLMISPLAEEIKFFMQIKNQGNYISNPGNTNFYLSSDTLLDASDFLLGSEGIPGIRPDLKQYVNLQYEGPTNLLDFAYLIYELDSNNTTTESNETNNIGYWPLGLGGVTNYPYLENFNDTIVDGWNYYVLHYSTGDYIKNSFRFRNMRVAGENDYELKNSGEMTTDHFDTNIPIEWVPYRILETPMFNFEDKDSIFLSFDLMCTGHNSISYDGGNFDYSTDGGNTWTLLVDDQGLISHNWYNYFILNVLGERGWHGEFPAPGLNYLDSTSYDLSFLKGEENVVFRFKYKSNTDSWAGSSARGMRIDDFKIVAHTVDYIALDSLVAISTSLSSPSFELSYNIANAGESAGRMSSTQFYWSVDSIFDALDQLLQVNSANPVASGNQLSFNVEITYPTPITQGTYYLFYQLDAGANLLETNESNNIGSFRIQFAQAPNYTIGGGSDSLNVSMTLNSFVFDYRIANIGDADGDNSNTGFYWSEDEVFDSSDPLALSIAENPILVSDTLFGTANIAYPVNINQNVYYLFYTCDSADDISEYSNDDNTAKVKVRFLSPEYSISSPVDSIILVSSVPSFDFTYKINNSGTENGIPSNTAFYWSTDDVFDSMDQSVQLIVEPIIALEDSLIGITTITYPTPVFQENYYLFFETDADNEIFEFSENDNRGHTKVVFDNSNAIAGDLASVLTMYVSDHTVYLNCTNSAHTGEYKLSLYSNAGSLIFSRIIELTNGLNIQVLPDEIPTGVYVLSLEKGKSLLTQKIVLKSE